MRLFRLGIATPLLALFAVLGSPGQQVADSNFHFENATPAFDRGAGPVVCIDEGHHNFHTASGRYKPFAELLRTDGYRVKGLATKFTRDALASCAALVIANPGATEHDPWAYPHDSAFTQEEISELLAWVREGGALELFIDHQPFPGVAAGLGTALGVVMLDGVVEARPDAPLPELFLREDGTLKPHPIVSGRNPQESIERVGTFTGQGFFPSREFQPLLVFGADAVGYADLEEQGKGIGEDHWPRFSLAGWVQGAAREWGVGRVVILGEAGLCTAQLVGGQRRPLGMNHPQATQNAQFCLNTIRWLTGVIK